MPLLGSDVKDPNFTLRFCLIAFCGVAAFGIVIVWKASLFLAVDYQEFPVSHEQVKIKNHNKSIQEKLGRNLIETQTEE